MSKRNKTSVLATHSPEIGLSVIIPAHNEEAYLASCLDALLGQTIACTTVEIIVSANACSDNTVPLALSYKSKFSDKDWKMRVLRTRQGGKVVALNNADSFVRGAAVVYLDADVICSSNLLAELAAELSTSKPRYVTGRLIVAQPKTWVTKHFSRIWVELPFVKGGAVGAGLFSVNRQGRSRWQAFPDIISDDTFVRLLFSPKERLEVSAEYTWPLVEGMRNLVRVRRRQDAGVKEIAVLFPNQMQNEDKGKADVLRLFLTNPTSFLVYCCVLLLVRLFPDDNTWIRGR